MDKNETPLKGGKVTEGVVRIGNHVHRPKGQHSDFVHQLLYHLESVNFQGAPRFLGIDELGREILTYIEGEVPANLGIWSDNQIIAAAQLIRQFHDATVGSVVAGNEEIVCHNDLSPCNTVMKEGTPIALIDFDAALPGKRLHDLAYAVWLWCDLGNEEIKAMEQSRRIKLFCESYGFFESKKILASIIKIQKLYIKKFQENVENGMLEWSHAVLWAEQSMQWLLKNKNLLIDKL